MNKKIFFAIFMMAAPSVASANVAVSTISCQGLRLMSLKRTPGLIVVDVRGPGSYAAGHIQGALSIPAGAILAAGLSKEVPIVLYCSEASCPLSHETAQKMIGAGYTRIQVLDGGLAAWVQEGYPTEKSAALRQRIEHDSARAARKKIASSGMFVIDLRAISGYRAGHIPGAVDIPLETLAQNLSAIPKNREVLVYDLVQSRMRRGVEELAAAGIKARELSGGFAAWVREKNRVEVKE